uniref:Putative secreted protein n=1 Tax=Ixodes ricinus TaxID=34613 RepID=A0A6B0U2A1_IXORI
MFRLVYTFVSVASTATKTTATTGTLRQPQLVIVSRSYFLHCLARCVRRTLLPATVVDAGDSVAQNATNDSV